MRLIVSGGGATLQVGLLKNKGEKLNIHDKDCLCENCLIQKWKDASQNRIKAGISETKHRKKRADDSYRCYLAYMGIRKLL